MYIFFSLELHETEIIIDIAVMIWYNVRLHENDLSLSIGGGVSEMSIRERMKQNTIFSGA